MRHHSDYLLSNVKIIEFFLSISNGLRVTYELDGNTYFLFADKQRLTTLLSDIYLIDDRKVDRGVMMVKWAGVWVTFAEYVSSVRFNTIDLVLIVSRHESTKAIQKFCTDEALVASWYPICEN
jgi:hypothetical protein